MVPIIVSMLIGVVGLAVVALLFWSIHRVTVKDEKAKIIANAIYRGAMTFLKEEYKIIAVVICVISALLAFVAGLQLAALIFIGGALLSMLTGLLGMLAATAANVRTTMAAKEFGEEKAFQVSFFGGGVMGFAVASFGLIGLSKIFYLFHE